MFKTRFISMLVLLMTAVTGAWADITITWGSAELSSLTDDQLLAGATKTVNGITVTVNAGTNNFLAVSPAGTMFSATNDNAFTFSTELGNFTKIECTSVYLSGTLGNGWVGATWTGDANSVNMSNAGSLLAVSSITFTIGEPAASTYTVTLKEGTEDATNWTITPAEATTTGVAAGTEVKATYGGMKKVKSVKAVKKAAAPVPVTYTALSGGEVLHVGDIIEIPDGQEWRINNSYIMSSRNPLTVVRANITFDQWDELTVTEAADGAYYVIKDTGGWYYCTYEGFTLPVTGTSDGIYVTYNGILWDEYPDYTFSVHEK